MRGTPQANEQSHNLTSILCPFTYCTVHINMIGMLTASALKEGRKFRSQSPPEQAIYFRSESAELNF